MKFLTASPTAAIQAADSLSEPFGESPYLEQIEFYSRQAFSAGQAGAEHLTLHMPGLHEARAAVLGARGAQLPLYVLFSTDESEPEKLLAALLCLQTLDIAGFGLEFTHVNSAIISLYAELAPYAKVSLVASPVQVSPADRAALARAGVEVLFLPSEQQPDHEFASLQTRLTIPPRPESAPLLLCDASGVYYLEEDFTLSQEIDCSRDMLESILEQEELAVDALYFRIKTPDDAYFFGLNIHMARCAVCIRAEGAELLEFALILYSGRALIDARSDVDKATLQALAKSYGAVIR